jgi:putative FmdB family regulatory protein
MPLYEYECEACGHRFEKIQKFSDPPVEQCPVCEGTVRKLLSSPAIQFKGSGWYITDYARKEAPSTAKTEKGEGAANAATEGKADGKTESKVDGKAEPKAAAKSDVKSGSKTEAGKP